MSSPEKSDVDKDDGVVLEGDDNSTPELADSEEEHNSPASSKGDPTSELSDISNESSDDAPNTDCSSNIPLPHDAQKGESTRISGEQSKRETSPSTTKKSKNKVEEESALLGCKGSEHDSSGASTSKEKDPTSPAAPELPPSISDPKAGPFTLTNAPRTPEKRDVKVTAVTPAPCLRGLLSVNTPPTPPESPRQASGHNPMAHSVSGRLLANLSASGSTKPSILQDILSKPPIIPSHIPHIPTDTNAPSVSNTSGEKKQTASQACPLLTNLLRRGSQSSSGSSGAVGLAIPSQTSGQSNVSEHKNKPLPDIPIETKHVSDMQEEDYSEEDTSSDEPSSQSSVEVTPEPKNKPSDVGESPGMEHNIDRMLEEIHNIKPLSPLKLSPENLKDKKSEEASEDKQLDDDNLSMPPSSPPTITLEPKVIELSVQLSDTANEVPKDSGDSNISGQAEELESKLPSQTLIDTPEPGFAPSNKLDEATPISVQMSSQSSSPPSNNFPSAPVSAIDDSSIESLGTESEASSQPTSSMDISPEPSQFPMDEDSSSRSSQKVDDNLEGIKLEISSKTNTPSRKSKRLQKTKSSESKTAPSAPEVPSAVNPADTIFKKPLVTPSRLQTMKNRLEGIKLEETSGIDSPTRRSPRIQLKESGAASKDATSFEKGKNLRPKPGTSASSNEKTKESEKSKSLSRERVTKLRNEGDASRSASLERAKTKGKTLQTRFREGTSASTAKARKKESSRERTSSDENVAGRTRATIKARLASTTSSNSETDKVEEDDKMARRTRATIKARLASTTSSNSETDKMEEDQNKDARAKRKSRKDSSK